MNYSKRFYRISQLLFTSQIDDNEKAVAQKAVGSLDKVELSFKSWIEGIEKNLEVFNNYHGKETSLVVISEVFEDTMKRQKEKYEAIINDMKQVIETIVKINDVEMEDMITNLTKASEEFSEIYNELINAPLKIGETGFIKEFKDNSQKIINSNGSIFDVLDRIKDYMKKNIMGEQSLS